WFGGQSWAYGSHSNIITGGPASGQPGSTYPVDALALPPPAPPAAPKPLDEDPARPPPVPPDVAGTMTALQPQSAEAAASVRRERKWRERMRRRIAPPQAAGARRRYLREIVTFLISGALSGRSPRTGTLAILWTTSTGSHSPKMVYPLSRCGAAASVMKNWAPFVFLPRFAMQSRPARSWFASSQISSGMT